ncbi:22170_t:CDS:2, partial [Gigaspora margarita]
PNNQIQNFKNPWLNQNLDTLQIEELFDLTSEMQTLLDRQLHDYLLTIITELCKKKSENINVIDDLVINQSAKTSNQKQCRECGKNEIENSKRKCPQCYAKLPILAETQQESEQTIPDKKEPQDNVDTTNILVPDPLPINPNSIDNIRKVFDHIQKISGINNAVKKVVATMEYADSESLASFLNPNENDCSFESLDRTNKLSAQMKLFTQLQSAESSLKKEEILFTIETLIEFLNEAK